MAPEVERVREKIENMIFPSDPKKRIRQGGETGLLIEAFEMFTKASSSLETAYSQLQAKAQELTEELEAKNLELEKSLREKEEAQNFLHNILERLPCGVLVLDDRGDLTLCNPMAAEVLTKSGKHRRPYLNSGVRSYLASSVARSGSKREVEIPLKRGKKQKILATSGAPLTDAGGDQVGTLHIIRDITEMKALQEQNKRVERLSAMGEMAVELAHEIRNPLGSVELFASLLEKEVSGDLKRWAENIRIGSRSLNNIVSNMLHFANPLSPAFAEVDIHRIIQDVLAFTHPIMNQRKVRILKQLKADQPVLCADSELIKQMMLNLIMNAMNAMPSEGSLLVQTKNIKQEHDSGRGLEVKIQDSGIGIPPENLNRIFDPFFTTNKKGTGLGLSVVHRIVEQHSGTIRVSSEINHGTTFIISFGTRPSEPEKSRSTKESMHG
ncbi:MAG: PAS domain-containing protein [Acidobacteria bacterium]|nr:PAS domain-containing protein [Acidobacteriota bacterium]